MFGGHYRQIQYLFGVITGTIFARAFIRLVFWLGRLLVGLVSCACFVFCLLCRLLQRRTLQLGRFALGQFSLFALFTSFVFSFFL